MSPSPTLIWAEAADIIMTIGRQSTINVSQQIDRMGGTGPCAPCVTPKAGLFSYQKGRPFFGADKFLFQAFPVMDLKLNHLTETVPCLQKVISCSQASSATLVFKPET